MQKREIIPHESSLPRDLSLSSASLNSSLDLTWFWVSFTILCAMTRIESKFLVFTCWFLVVYYLNHVSNGKKDELNYISRWPTSNSRSDVIVSLIPWHEFILIIIKEKRKKKLSVKMYCGMWMIFVCQFRSTHCSNSPDSSLSKPQKWYIDTTRIILLKTTILTFWTVLSRCILQGTHQIPIL